MVTVQVLKSPRRYQTRRLEAFLTLVREELPDITVDVIDLAEREDLMKAHNILFGPAILINGRLDFIGIPSMKWFRKRLEAVRKMEGTSTAEAAPQAGRPTPPEAASPPGEAPRPVAPPKDTNSAQS